MASLEMFVSISSQLVFFILLQNFQPVFSTIIFVLPSRRTCQKVLLIESQNMEQKKSSEIVLSKFFRRGNVRVKYLPLLTSAPMFCLYLFYEKTLFVISCVALDKLPRTLWLS